VQITSSAAANLRPFMNYISLENKIENLSDINPTFTDAVYEFTYLLI